MDLLFRPVFTRVKTPVIGSATDRQSSGASTDENNDAEEFNLTSTRLRSTPRVSSYIGFRTATPPIPAPENFPHFRDLENIYHKPSGDQLAEMLKVVMMNQSNMDPIPIQYNSTVLHVLEAYHDLSMQLNAKEEAIELLKQNHTKDIKDFEELATQWQEKECDYKSELKKLEVLLSKTEGGMESVSLARSKSVIHGAERASETIKRGIQTIKERTSARDTQDAGVNYPDIGPLHQSVKSRPSFQTRDEGASFAATSFEPSRRPSKERNMVHFQGEHLQYSSQRQLWDSLEVQTAKALMQGSGEYQPVTLTKTQLEALERQQAQESGLNFDSSTSGTDSNSVSYRSGVPALPKTPVLGLGILEKALPEIPNSAKKSASQTTLDKYLNDGQQIYADFDTSTPIKHRADYEMGFSFQPGDDEDLLSRSSEHHRAQRKTVYEHLEHRPSLPSLKVQGFNTPTSSINKTSNRASLAHIQNPRAKVSPTHRSSQLPRLQEHDHDISRMDSSSSSVVTAVRDSSGCSSTNNSQAGRSRLKRNTETTTSGSSEAVSAATAAARAYAASNKRPSTESSRKGSESGETRAYVAGKKRPSTESSRKAPESGETKKDATGKDVECNRIPTADRRTPIFSTTLSLNDSEAGNAKTKTQVGGVKKIEKS